jgi:hypothetical protein
VSNLNPIPDLPLPVPASGITVPPHWFPALYRVVAALSDEVRRLRAPGTSTPTRRERTTALVEMTAADAGNVHTTAETQAETEAAEIRSIGGVILTAGEWHVATWLDWGDGAYWTVAPADLALAGAGIGGHWREKAAGAETIVLDDARDYRRRSIEVSIAEDNPSADSATKTSAIKWVRCANANVDLVTLGNYTVRIDTTGALVLVASGSSTNHYVVWARASQAENGICKVCEDCLEDGYDVQVTISGFTGTYPSKLNGVYVHVHTGGCIFLDGENTPFTALSTLSFGADGYGISIDSTDDPPNVASCSRAVMTEVVCDGVDTAGTGSVTGSGAAAGQTGAYVLELVPAAT